MANLQENLILDQIRQVIYNLICTFDLQINFLDEGETWAGILSTTDFAVQIIYNKIL